MLSASLVQSSTYLPDFSCLNGHVTVDILARAGVYYLLDKTETRQVEAAHGFGKGGKEEKKLLSRKKIVRYFDLREAKELRWS